MTTSVELGTLICLWLSAFNFSIDGHTALVNSSFVMPADGGDLNSNALGYCWPLSNIRTSSTNGDVAIAASRGAGSNFFPVIKVSCESARE